VSNCHPRESFETTSTQPHKQTHTRSTFLPISMPRSLGIYRSPLAQTFATGKRLCAALASRQFCLIAYSRELEIELDTLLLKWKKGGLQKALTFPPVPKHPSLTTRCSLPSSGDFVFSFSCFFCLGKEMIIWQEIRVSEADLLWFTFIFEMQKSSDERYLGQSI